MKVKTQVKAAADPPRRRTKGGFVVIVEDPETGKTYIW